MKKRLLAGLLAASMCLSMASCADDTNETTTSTQGSTTQTTTAQTSATQATASDTTQATETTTAQGTQTPETETNDGDLESVKVGSYITLRYNAASTEVTWEVKKGVGSRETVTLTATPKDDYLFDGWSIGNAMVNDQAAESTALTCEFTFSEAKEVFLNTSMQLVYHENGGTIVKSGFDGTDTFSAVFYQNPNTLPEQNYFAREGYTLTGYNTKADGSGEAVSLGSKVTGSKGKIELYCIWEENSPEADFEVKDDGKGVKITAYKGTSDTVVIPTEIGGKEVVSIDSSAFKGTQIKRVVIASTVTKIGANAFAGCKQLESVVITDTIEEINDSAFNNCSLLTNVRFNTTTEIPKEWYSSAAAKIDRLIWAKDKKKIIIIGGSGSLYGFDSDVIYEALNGEYEIINFGENANISALVYFDIAEDFVNEGDIILWCPEPGFYTLGYPRCSSRFWDFRKSNYDFTKYINPQYYEGFFSSFASFASALNENNMRGFDTLPSSISRYGDDITGHVWDGKKYDYNFNYQFSGGYDMEDVIEAITDKGASVFFSFAAMQESGMENVKEKDVLAYEKMLTSIPGIVSISDYHDLILEDSDFWNSAWHLSSEGATKRSEQVAKDIKKALENN